MSDPFFFGYGSLVNLQTHDFLKARPARLRGWRRVWCHTNLRDVAFLSVRPDPTTEIDGLIAEVPSADWQALDDREWAYQRHDVGHLVTHDQGDLHIEVYAVSPENLEKPSLQHPILLSYIDVVVQGFLQTYGEAGAEHFFATTDGWDAPVLDDRAAPIYPRAQHLSVMETDFVTSHLAHYGAVINQMD